MIQNNFHFSSFSTLLSFSKNTLAAHHCVCGQRYEILDFLRTNTILKYFLTMPSVKKKNEELLKICKFHHMYTVDAPF